LVAPNPDSGELILTAAGERIVAFARPGKHRKSRFARSSGLRPAQCNHAGFARALNDF
jgi:hypothetical protein